MTTAEGGAQIVSSLGLLTGLLSQESHWSIKDPTPQAKRSTEMYNDRHNPL